MNTKACRGCGKELPADTRHFVRCVDKPGMLSYKCKPCRNEEQKASVKRYREKLNGNPPKLHRRIYESVHGPIEKGMVIHHIDGDPSNNDISNLCKLTNLEHRRVHAGWEQREDGWWKPCSSCKKLMSVDNFSEHIKGSGRYQSRCKSCANKYPERVCPVCSNNYTPCYKNQKTCSSKCSGKLRSQR